MTDSLTFELHPKSDELSLDTLIDSISDLRRLISLVDYAVTRDKRGRAWLVERIHSSAPTIVTRPELDGAVAIDAIANGIQILTAQAEPIEAPMYWTDDALDELRAMRRLFFRKKGLGQIIVRAGEREAGAIRDNIRQQVDRVIRGGYSMLSSVEGTLEAINLRRKRFTIWDRVSGRPVSVFITAETRERVKALLDKRVLVAGKVHYYRTGVPHLITNADRIREITEPPPGSPTAGFGSIPELGEGTSGSELLHTLRD